MSIEMASSISLSRWPSGESLQRMLFTAFQTLLHDFSILCCRTCNFFMCSRCLDGLSRMEGSIASHTQLRNSVRIRINLSGEYTYIKAAKLPCIGASETAKARSFSANSIFISSTSTKSSMTCRRAAGEGLRQYKTS